MFINGIMLGLTKREITRRFDEIVEFAELQDFIDAPVKTYSSRRYMRLGFAVAIHVDPDVLLVDEVLAVGDEGFTHKCLDKFADFKRRGKTILLVTHSLGLVEKFCDEALWMDAGRTKLQGDPKRVVGAYITDVEKSEEQHLAAADAKAKVAVRWFRRTNRPRRCCQTRPSKPGQHPPTCSARPKAAGGHARSRSLTFSSVGADGTAGHVFHSGESLTIAIQLRAPLPMDDFVLGVGVFNAEGSVATAPTPASSSYAR